ncbi:EthD family reductase [Pseudoalteromonas rubra]|uniref:EthD family reductase n=1 Tax=Pseudoalteromonas rubra TaxID=43658 RepID=A0A5S3WW08_9GAMM|nr:EthD family reductase [Pseudoalteromonas rubra]TMP32928.1 EthD family reductase [Pseudoalteromonas rubra]
MIKVSVLYPKGENITFDTDYYCNKHIPLAKARFGSTCKKVEVEAGIGEEAPYIAVGNLYFESVEAFQFAFAQHEAELMGDVVNYTNATPVVQMSKVLIS